MKRKDKAIERSSDKKKAHVRGHFIPKGYDMAVCTGCHLIFKESRWFYDDDLYEISEKKKTTHKVTCSACIKVRDNNPDGVIMIRGAFLLDHIAEIKHIALIEERNAKAKSPFDRVVKMIKSPNEFMITTTEQKFTQRIARMIHRAFSSDISFEWLHEEKFVRITCYRD